ncbi:MAG: FHA domain-containing protein [Chloroflexi bacterium]|nr:FHA domain-containing protein [Chloroflexota bacterium]
MGPRSAEMIRQVTSELSEEKLWDLQLSKTDMTYQPVPHQTNVPADTPVWRVRFDLTYNPSRCLGLDINGEIVLGRGDDTPGIVSLNLYDADELGVSRQHVMMRPTDAKLYVIDLDSTNGTRINGRSIGVKTPYSVSNGDILALGQLEFVVRIIKRPTGYAAAQRAETDLADVLSPLARAITSQLAIEDVLKQALEMTIALTGVEEASIWLVDEQTGELFLEAEQGIENEQIRRMRLSVVDTLAGKVIETGKPLRANRQSGDGQIKVKTGYLVEAVMYVPLTLGGVTFGVLLAAHRAAGKQISARDEKMITTIADFAAVAVQNARLFQTTDSALSRRVKVMTALNYALSYDLKNKVNNIIGYAGLLQVSHSFDEDAPTIVGRIGEAAESIARLIDQLIEIMSLNEDSIPHQSPCDLIEIVARSVNDMHKAAANKMTTLDFQVIGDPYIIQGDAQHLYRSVFNLIDNAIKYSPSESQVFVALCFFHNEILIRVRDTGPGIPKDDLPLLFDRYYRGKQTAEAGVGLGLELVRATAEAHRGAVIARNVEAGGAEFIITLPGTLRVA